MRSHIITYRVNPFNSNAFSQFNRLLVATQNGFLYVYDVSEIEGGDCKLVIKHDLRNIDTQPIKIHGNHWNEITFNF